MCSGYSGQEHKQLKLQLAENVFASKREGLDGGRMGDVENDLRGLKVKRLRKKGNSR